MTTTHFMVMYDSCCGAYIKDQFASIGVNNVQVGSFDMLLDMLLEYRLLTKNQNNKWEYDVSQAILADKKAFWNKSIQVDETVVIEEVTKSLKLLLNSLSLDFSLLPELKNLENKRYAKTYRFFSCQINSYLWRNT